MISDKKQNVKRNLAVVYLQVATVAAIIIALLLVRYFNPLLFSKLKNGYDKSFQRETDINEVLTVNEEPPEYSNPAPNSVAVMTLATVNSSAQNSFTVPLKGTVTSHYGGRLDPFGGDYKIHKGTDIAAKSGTEILAPADGTVAFVGNDPNGYGNYFTIDHSTTMKTLYGHCDTVLVEKGQEVKAGQVIATVGNSGASTGAHLHFEIRFHGKTYDAERYFDFRAP